MQTATVRKWRIVRAVYKFLRETGNGIGTLSVIPSRFELILGSCEVWAELLFVHPRCLELRPASAHQIGLRLVHTKLSLFRYLVRQGLSPVQQSVLGYVRALAANNLFTALLDCLPINY